MIGNDNMITVYTLTEKIPAVLLRWGAEPVQHFAFPGEYVRIGRRTWALWLGAAPSSKYVYTFPKEGAK